MKKSDVVIIIWFIALTVLLIVGCSSHSNTATPKSPTEIEPSQLFLQSTDLTFGDSFSSELWKSCPTDVYRPENLRDEDALSQTERKWSFDNCSDTLSKITIRQIIWILPNERTSQRLEENVRDVSSQIINVIWGVESLEQIPSNTGSIYVIRNHKSFSSAERSSIVIRLGEIVMLIDVNSNAPLAIQDLSELGFNAIARVEDALRQ